MSSENKKNSALSEQKGVPQPTNINKSSILKIKKQKTQHLNIDNFVKYITQGNISYLSRAITLVESTNANHHKKAMQLLEACLTYANKSVRIGITGVPGVGKSTFIESFGKFLTSLGKKVAVLAVDPSSSINKGSILGDKTRMGNLVKDQMAFIRPSPSGSTFGGVARATRESILLCEAAGFDIVLIETVGVGQSETNVHNMVDFFLLLKLAGAGDELQGIKRGIIEMADAIVINKADGHNKKAADLAKADFNRALHLYPVKESQWQPKVLTCSATENNGISEIWELIKAYIDLTKDNGFFKDNRKLQNKYWLETTIKQQLLGDFENLPKIKSALKLQLASINKQETTPFLAAQKLLELYYKK
ncbi:MAG: methylmalonyl Co-A mutase-associated GTPase MeaB [Flavobacteriaceae bacterium]|nr:methylmalonyl Co-A mutase-associated GTPase MeaB [Flavobacteriaceae bacterium]